MLAVVTLLAAFLAQVTAQANPFPTVTTNVPVKNRVATNRLVDEFGREVYFHGANVVTKSTPWLPNVDGPWDPKDSFVAKDMRMMQRLGLNGIRLGTMWPGVEPQRGRYNHTYLRKLTHLVTAASQYGIYSLLDMHQDVMSEKFCGEGVPLWAAVANTTNFPFPLSFTPYNVSAEGVPTFDDCHSRSWTGYYFTEAAGQGFQNLYTNVDGLRDAWVKFWGQVAKYATTLGSSVIGFELINEPWAGDAVQHLEDLIPGVTDKKYLQPMYDLAAAEIRKYDTAHTIAFEPVTWDDFGCGFEHVPGGSSWQNLSVLSYHFYLPPDFAIDWQFPARKNDMARLGSAGILSEFGIAKCPGCGNTEPNRVMDACDDYQQSWLFWEFKPFPGNKTGWSYSVWNPDGSFNADVAAMVARTYAQYVAGRSLITKFNTTTKEYKLVYTVDAAVSSNTSQIFFSEEFHYPKGFNVTTSPAGVQWTQMATNVIQLQHDSGLPSGTNVTFVIVPTSS